jgi:hypothetical protein
MLDEWARRWNIPAAAMRELVAGSSTPQGRHAGVSEAGVQGQLRIDAANRGWVLWRNNVGAVDGLRYGLCNDSKGLNDMLKSSDLIGIRPVLVTEKHIGQTIGQFAAVEVKKGNWRPGKSKRELAQGAFLALVRKFGGFGAFSTGELPDA